MMKPSYRCVRCEYDLHGLPPEGNCPECGLDRRLSLNCGATEWLNERFASRVRRGLELILLAQLAWVGALFLNDWLKFLVAIPIGLAALGAILLTVHPYRAASFWDRATRFTAGLTFVLSVCIGLAAIADRRAGLVVALLFGVCWCSCVLATFQTVGDLAERAAAFEVVDAVRKVSLVLSFGMISYPLALIAIVFLSGEALLMNPVFWIILVGGGLGLLLVYVVAIHALVLFRVQLSPARLTRLFGG